jgi:hypothetical protein
MLFAGLVLTGLLGGLLGVPWSIAVLGDPATAWLSAGVEVLLLLVPASATGVWLGKRVGLNAVLRDLVSRVPGCQERVRFGLLPAVMVGLILGVAGFLAQSEIPKSAWMPALANPSTFEWFLRCLSAALTEEIFFRLGLMTLFVWLIRLLIKKPGIPALSLWIGNLLAALLFAAAHFPQLNFAIHGWRLWGPSVLFSTSAGAIMGWLYLRYGLLSAMVAHFLADLIVYVVPGLVSAVA